MTKDDGRPEWDGELGDALVGCRVIIGLTYKTAGGEVKRREQLHGVVARADASGVRVRLQGAREGEFYELPPHPSAFNVADPGVYRLRGTGEEIVDPDFVTTWTINAPD